MKSRFNIWVGLAYSFEGIPIRGYWATSTRLFILIQSLELRYAFPFNLYQLQRISINLMNFANSQATNFW